jgi:hypothetical protein
MRSKSTSRSVTLSTDAIVEFHALAGHAGPTDGCQDCAARLERQRRGAAELRSHQRQTRQRIDAILRKAAEGSALVGAGAEVSA